MKVQKLESVDQPPEPQVLMGNSPCSLPLTCLLCSFPQGGALGLGPTGRRHFPGVGKECGTPCEHLGLYW